MKSFTRFGAIFVMGADFLLTGDSSFVVFFQPTVLYDVNVTEQRRVNKSVNCSSPSHDGYFIDSVDR